MRKHEPIAESAMNRVSPENTICETIRQAYRRIDDPEARLSLRVATSMAKSMADKLSEYQRNWRSGYWEPNGRFPKPIHEKPIDVLFLCWDDCANTMFRFWQCAKHLGLNSIMFKGVPHAFGYPQQAPIHPSLANTPICGAPVTVMAPGLESLIYSARVVHLGASTYPMVAVDWSKINVVVQHGGTVYRQHPQECNDLFNQIAQKTVIQMPDLMNLGAKNESWIYYPVDTVNLKPDFPAKSDKLVIGHFPSNPEVKGSAMIDSVMQRLQGEYDFTWVYDPSKVKWSDNLKRMAACDVIVDGCAAMQGDKVYGEWGNQTLEASALGCAVVTHHVHREMYRAEFGDFGPLVANSEAELESVVETLLSANQEQITALKHRCRAWAEIKHGIAATADRLWDLVYKPYFE